MTFVTCFFLVINSLSWWGWWCFLEGDFYPPKKPQKAEKGELLCPFQSWEDAETVGQMFGFGGTHLRFQLCHNGHNNQKYHLNLKMSITLLLYLKWENSYPNPFRTPFRYWIGEKTWEKDLWNGFTIKAFKCKVCVLKIGLSKSFSGLALLSLLSKHSKKQLEQQQEAENSLM